MLVAEAEERDRRGSARERSRDRAHEELPQLVDRHVRRVDDLVRHARGWRSAARRSSRMPSLTDRSGASGCGRRVSLNRRTSAAWLASRKISTGLSRGIFRSRAEDLRERREEVAFAHVDDDRDLLDVAAGAQRQLRQRRNQRRRQVVDAEVAEILERADRLRLSRAGQPGQDDERPSRLGSPGVRLLAGAADFSCARRFTAASGRCPRRLRLPGLESLVFVRHRRRARAQRLVQALARDTRAAWWPRARSS